MEGASGDVKKRHKCSGFRVQGFSRELGTGAVPLVNRKSTGKGEVVHGRMDRWACGICAGR